MTTKKLTPGYYEWQEGQLVRTADTVPLVRYHGTLQPHGQKIDRFRPSSANFEGRPALNKVAGVYTTDSAGIAEQYSQGASVNAPHNSGDLQAQVYKLRLEPSVVVNVGTGEDDTAVRAAVAGGADVLEVPDFGEQPETIVLDPSIISVEQVTETESGRDVDDLAREDADFAEESYDYWSPPDDDEYDRETEDTLGENTVMVTASREKPTLEDAITDFKDKDALDKAANTRARNSIRKNVDYVRQQPKETPRAPSRGRGMKGLGR